MITLLLILLPFFIQLTVLSVSAHRLNDLLYRGLGKFLYLVFMIPGVMVHELSHLIGCWITLTRVIGIHLFDPHEESPGSLVLGRIEHVQAKTWLASVIIGSAPFFGGSAALWLFLTWLVPGAAHAAGFSYVTATGSEFATLIHMYGLFLTAFLSHLDWHSWQTYLYFYFVLAIGSHLVPSPVDRQHMSWALIGLTFLLLLTTWLTGLVGVDTQQTFLTWIGKGIGSTSVILSYALCLVLFAAVILGGLSLFVGWLRRRKQNTTGIIPPQTPS